MTKERSFKRKRKSKTHVHEWVESPLKEAFQKDGRDGFRIIMACRACPMKRSGKWNPVLASVL